MAVRCASRVGKVKHTQLAEPRGKGDQIRVNQIKHGKGKVAREAISLFLISREVLQTHCQLQVSGVRLALLRAAHVLCGVRSRKEAILRWVLAIAAIPRVHD